MGDAAPIIVAILGTGGAATVVGLILHYRSDTTRTYAEAGKLGAETDVALSDGMQRRYDSLFDDLERELGRLHDSEAACRNALDATREQLDKALIQIAKLRVEAANATADVKLARAEIVRLQDHLDVLEEKVNRRKAAE